MSNYLYTLTPDNRAQEIAQRFGLTIQEKKPLKGLWYDGKLAWIDPRFSKPFWITENWQNTQQHPLKKALGKAKTVVDITAGLGRDASLMRQLGMKVTMIEASPLIAALLYDTYGEVWYGTYQDWLKKHSDCPDIFYWDPMYLPKKRKAQASKRIQILETLAVVSSPEIPLKALLDRCKISVIVKRHRHAQPIQNQTPQRSYDQGAATRYDVYTKY